MIWCDAKWCDVKWCDVKWCDAIWHEVMWWEKVITFVKNDVYFHKENSFHICSSPITKALCQRKFSFFVCGAALCAVYSTTTHFIAVVELMTPAMMMMMMMFIVKRWWWWWWWPMKVYVFLSIPSIRQFYMEWNPFDLFSQFNFECFLIWQMNAICHVVLITGKLEIPISQTF